MKERGAEPHSFLRTTLSGRGLPRLGFCAETGETSANILSAFIEEVGRFRVVWCYRAGGRYIDNTLADELSRRRFERPVEERRPSRPLKEEDLGAWPNREGKEPRKKSCTQRQTKHPNQG